VVVVVTNPEIGGGVMKQSLSPIVALSLIAFSAVPANAQQYKYETPIAPGIATPDKVDTSIGTLNLSSGYPDAATVQKICNNLDASRALQAYLLALPIRIKLACETRCANLGQIIRLTSFGKTWSTRRPWS
jgi:hypothetical protein